jgi:hypothetical protein
MDSDRLQPALFGGLFIGVLSALPFVNTANCCCCLWAIAGGVLATYLRQQNFRYQVTAAEGALVGLMAGAIGGVIYVVLSIPIQALTGPMQQQMMERVMAGQGELPPEVQDMMARMTAGGLMSIALFVNAVFYTVFGLLGGLLGVALFKRDAPPPPPPGTMEVLPPE